MVSSLPQFSLCSPGNTSSFWVSVLWGYWPHRLIDRISWAHVGSLPQESTWLALNLGLPAVCSFIFSILPKDSSLFNLEYEKYLWSFPGGSDGKPSAYNAGDTSSISESERSPGGGNSNSLQYSCLGNPVDRGAWRVTVHVVTKSWKWLSTHTHVVNHILEVKWNQSLKRINL